MNTPRFHGYGSGQWPHVPPAGPDATAVDAIPPERSGEVMADVRRWAPQQPVDLRAAVPLRSAAPLVPQPEPAPLSRRGRLGKVRFMGVDIIGPWYGPATKHWWAVVPGPDGDRKAEAATEEALYGVITEMLQRGR